MGDNHPYPNAPKQACQEYAKELGFEVKTASSGLTPEDEELLVLAINEDSITSEDPQEENITDPQEENNTDSKEEIITDQPLEEDDLVTEENDQLSFTYPGSSL